MNQSYQQSEARWWTSRPAELVAEIDHEFDQEASLKVRKEILEEAISIFDSQPSETRDEKILEWKTKVEHYIGTALRQNADYQSTIDSAPLVLDSLAEWSKEIGERSQAKIAPFRDPLPSLSELQSKYLQMRAKYREKEVKLEQLRKAQKEKAWFNEVQLLRKELKGLTDQNQVLKKKVEIVNHTSNINKTSPE